MDNQHSESFPSVDRRRLARERTSRWLTRAWRRVTDPQAVFERTVRRIVAEGLERSRTGAPGEPALQTMPSGSQPPRHPRPGSATATSDDPPSADR